MGRHHLKGRQANVGADPLETAFDALRYRDLSVHELEQRLASKGFAEHDRAGAIATLARTGLLDDRRFANRRAASLAERGAGDVLIRDALGRAGIEADVVEEAVAALDPEKERASAIVDRRGRTPKTARYLSAKGFPRETIAELIVAGLVADESADELG